MNTGKKPLTLLIHTGMAFEWYRSIVSEFQRQSANSAFTLNIAHRYQDILSTDGPVVLLSVDASWITENLALLGGSKHKAILFNGFTEEPPNTVSRIMIDHDGLIQKSVSHLMQKGRCDIAFFGAQKNDISDQKKADSFAKLVSEDHVYRITHDFGECFERLLSRINEYNGIICSNDIAAVYLLEKCSGLGIAVPDRLSIIGNGNLWISANTTPSITTISTDTAKMVSLTLRICRQLYQFEDIVSMDVYIKPSLIPRASTGCETDGKDQTKLKTQRMLYEESNTDKDLIIIQKIDRALSALSPQTLRMLKAYLNGDAYGKIADQMYISEDTLRYHIKKLYRSLDVHGKKECASILNRYLGNKS